MSENTKQTDHDEITRELKRAFFTEKEKKTSPEKEETKGKAQKPKRSRPSIFLVLIIMVALLVPAGFFFYIKGQTTFIKSMRPSPPKIRRSRAFYDFERNTDGWEIPYWAAEKPDHVAVSLAVSDKVASSGTSSLRIDADFPGGMWTAALIEIQQFLDLSKYDEISADILSPKHAPSALKRVSYSLPARNGNGSK